MHRTRVPHLVSAFRQASILAADAAATAAALILALNLRFDGDVPARYAAGLTIAIPLLIGVRLLANMTARIHQWSFTLAGLAEAQWVGLAGLAGSAAFYITYPRFVALGMPRTVYALEFFLSTSAFGILRFGPRLLYYWYRSRERRLSGFTRTIVVGIGAEAGSLARDLLRSNDHQYHLVGFVSHGPHNESWCLEGAPILGTVRELPDLIREHRIRAVLLADSHQSAATIRQVIDICSSSQVQFKIVPRSVASMDQRLSVAMLNDVSPEDLLPRNTIAFDQAEIRALVRGRKAFVTGAGGSIGSEICRQLARNEVRQLVMVDMNENELYLGARRLAQEFPQLEVHAEVADVRDPARLMRLANRYRPQDVFHAAAHKHVPLMEDAPEEAVKNNVFGTLHVAHMAHVAGADRFVFISTDKAVKPTSVMGATKRVAELVVRDLARTSKTRMSCVRFGNVLGSAGSVVPIFREQIARGGPVTVTHPDCRRYFMTIPEAVGLVLLAGLGGYGELCVLDMGEAIKIADLARNMITLAGRVPGDEIPIVYTGLRPGEKMYEEVLTEEEEQSEQVRNRIRATASPPPRADLREMLTELRECADRGDCDQVLEMLKELVPTYRVTRNIPVAAAVQRLRTEPVVTPVAKVPAVV